MAIKSKSSVVGQAPSLKKSRNEKVEFKGIKEVKNEESGKIEFLEIEDMLSINTTCKMFGACKYSEPVERTGKIVDGNGNHFTQKYIDLAGTCANCRQASEVKEACQILTGTYMPVVLKDLEVKERKVGTGTRKVVVRGSGQVSIKDFVGAMISKGIHTRKEIISMFLIEYPENNESQGGRYVSSAFNEKYSIKRWGKVAQSVQNIISWK